MLQNGSFQFSGYLELIQTQLPPKGPPLDFFGNARAGGNFVARNFIVRNIVIGNFVVLIKTNSVHEKLSFELFNYLNIKMRSQDQSFIFTSQKVDYFQSTYQDAY